MSFSHLTVLKKFRQRYDTEPVMVKSPGRINLLGEHVDYNDGFVMPASINYATVFAIGEAHGGRSEIYSLQYDEAVAVDTVDPQPVHYPKWANYLLGVIRKLKDDGYSLKPFVCVFGGDIPMGAGLSSSASIECGFIYSLALLNDLRIPRPELILKAQWAEHHFAGVKCGIMDQFASMMGRAGQVIMLDCRTLEHRYLPLALQGYALVLCDTKVKHALSDSAYNTRREECALGLTILKSRYPSVSSFRDVTKQMVVNERGRLPGKVFDRCLFVVQEIGRVTGAGDDLRSGDAVAFGNKMFETHKGLSELYEVSCAELDFLVAQAKDFPGVVGSRMMGGGFGGCTLNIVEQSVAEKFIRETSKRYASVFGFEMGRYTVSIEEGTHVLHTQVETYL